MAGRWGHPTREESPMDVGGHPTSKAQSPTNMGEHSSSKMQNQADAGQTPFVETEKETGG